MTGTAEVFAANLRARRITAGLSQAELAARVGMTQTSLSYWESGKRQPSFADLDRLATALDTAVAVLLTDLGRVADMDAYRAGYAAAIRAAAEAVKSLS